MQLFVVKLCLSMSVVLSVSVAHVHDIYVLNVAFRVFDKSRNPLKYGRSYALFFYPSLAYFLLQESPALNVGVCSFIFRYGVLKGY